MTDRTKTARIARENSETLAALRAGTDPETINSYFSRGWASAYTHAPDAPAKSGQIARFEAGAAARIAHDSRVTREPAPASVVCHCEVSCHHDSL